ncbi:cytochrome b/b6 domain-containing protein [Pseudoalteromonas xiamenensis]
MNKSYLVDRLLHWAGAFLVIIMMLNMNAQIHITDYRLKGQILHRQDAVSNHALLAMIVLTLVLSRLAFNYFFPNSKVRKPIENPTHARFIAAVRIGLVLTLFGLVTTGFLMAANIDIPFNLFGIHFSEGGEKNLSSYSDIQSLHHTFMMTLWWLIGIHVIGALYANK